MFVQVPCLVLFLAPSTSLVMVWVRRTLEERFQESFPSCLALELFVVYFYCAGAKNSIATAVQHLLCFGDAQSYQSARSTRRPPGAEVSTPGEAEAEAPEAEASNAPAGDGSPARPIVLLTCAGGIRSAGLAALVDALVAGGRCDVHVCAPESDKPACGHSITIRETITAISVDFTGAKAFEISGTPRLTVSHWPYLEGCFLGRLLLW
ncbi:unnamed protein product [Urochloa humidicola]